MFTSIRERGWKPVFQDFPSQLQFPDSSVVLTVTDLSFIFVFALK